MSLETNTLPAYPDVPVVPGAPAVAQNPATQGLGADGAPGPLPAGITARAGSPLAQQLDASPDSSVTYNGTTYGPSFTAPVTTADGTAYVPGNASGGQSSIASLPTGPQWGIFDQNGDPVIAADTVLAVDLRKEQRIADFPIERGGFASYNKVSTPFDARLSFAIGGTSEDRAEFLADVDAAWQSLALYTVVTPDFSYPNGNVSHYDYSRKRQNGATLLTVDVWVQEIRLTSPTTFVKTQDPSGADPVNGGTVPPTAPTAAQAQAPAKAVKSATADPSLVTDVNTDAASTAVA